MRIFVEPDISISDEVATFLVAILESGVGDSIKEDVRVNRLVQPNSTPSRIWDYINRDVAEQAETHGCLCNLTKRGPWTMSILYDSSSGHVITLMREKRFEELRRQRKTRENIYLSVPQAVRQNKRVIRAKTNDNVFFIVLTSFLCPHI